MSESLASRSEKRKSTTPSHTKAVHIEIPLVKMDKGKSEQKGPRRLPGASGGICAIRVHSYCVEKKGENMKEEKNNTLDGRWRKANRS